MALRKRNRHWVGCFPHLFAKKKGLGSLHDLGPNLCKPIRTIPVTSWLKAAESLHDTTGIPLLLTCKVEAEEKAHVDCGGPVELLGRGMKVEGGQEKKGFVGGRKEKTGRKP